MITKPHLLTLIDAALEQRRKFAVDSNSFLLGYVTPSTERAAKRYLALTEAITAARQMVLELGGCKDADKNKS